MSPALKARPGWTIARLEYLGCIKQVIERLREWWPVTLRAVYYQLVAALVIENCLGEYKKLSTVLTAAREDGLVPWEALEDRSRRILWSDGWSNKNAFCGNELANFLRGYRRDLLQSQETRPELWIEKDTLAPIAHKIAMSYCVNVIVARGFASADYRNKCARRIADNTNAGQRTLILYFGDLDPSGVEMLPAMRRKLMPMLGNEADVEFRRCALLPDHVLALKLPCSIDAIKKEDSRTPKYRAWLREQGYEDNLAVELDALPPETLERFVREAIESELDLSALEAERQQQASEASDLETLRDDVRSFITERMGTPS